MDNIFLYLEPTELDQFLSASASIGANELLVQGAGGNTSYKEDDQLFIKASGAKLKESLRDDIYVNVNRTKILSRIKSGKVDPVKESWNDLKGLRPSIETTLHALLPHKFVFHVHCVNTISLVVQKDCEQKLTSLLKDFNWIRVPYCKPGVELTNYIYNLLSNRKPDLIFLSNHGLVVGGESVNETLDLLLEVSNKLYPGKRKIEEPDILKLKYLCLNSSYRPTKYPEAHQIALSKQSVNIASSGSLYPDHVVFLGPSLVTVKSKEELICLKKRKKLIEPLLVIAVPGDGILVDQNITDDCEDMVLALHNVVSRIPDNAKVNYLTKDQESELLNWDAEQYRLKISKIK